MKHNRAIHSSSFGYNDVLMLEKQKWSQMISLICAKDTQHMREGLNHDACLNKAHKVPSWVSFNVFCTHQNFYKMQRCTMRFKMPECVILFYLKGIKHHLILWGCERLINSKHSMSDGCFVICISVNHKHSVKSGMHHCFAYVLLLLCISILCY